MPRNGVSLYVNGVSDDVRSDDLRNMFEKYGKVMDVYVPLDFYTRRSRGFAYVQFENGHDAEEAMYYLDRKKLSGRNLEIQFAQGDRKTPYDMKSRERRRRHGDRDGRRSVDRRRRTDRRSRSRSRERPSHRGRKSDDRRAPRERSSTAESEKSPSHKADKSSRQKSSRAERASRERS
ncbi:hypothetical protein RvY_11453 [Ramazzottius varieornatus]|uniref:RRM domain-containing protein n=1 Tax=Ramazzottius varieornatus TaxID=947166 RepID=A0A1D1VG76_RAMVA|nr:hypothetical protein RvY_11453 [Ramazzottius varieornatus]